MIGISRIARKDESHMSFVGIHNTREGLIAFADSKATITHQDGYMKEDLKRGKIQKVFKNNRFIFVTYGNNELFSADLKMNLEDYVLTNLKNDISYEDFFERLYLELKKNPPEYNDGTYHFIIGSKDVNKKYYVVRLNIDLSAESPLVYSSRDYLYNTHFSGDDRYVNIYNYYPKYFDLNIIEYSKHIQQSITMLIESVEKVNLDYDSVGLPIRVEIFQ